jgi:SAM-dependent methyltransferase
MIDPPNTEIDVDEIMRRIKEEVERRKASSAQGTDLEPEPLISISPTTKDRPFLKVFDRFLWKYGGNYKRIVKTVPILKDIAKKQHSRLAGQFIHSLPVTKQSLPCQLNINVLPYYINYHGFLVQVKEQEGLKGRIKFFLFKFIRFFAWWQEQINRALYQELMTQKAKMEERDKRVEVLHDRVAFFSQAKDELFRELSEQKAKADGTVMRMEGLLSQQVDHLEGALAERDRVLSDTIESSKKELSGLLEVKSAVNHMTEEMRDHKLSILDQQRRLKALFEEAKKRLPKPIGPKQIKNILKEEDHLLDAMYVAFEDRFRGTREDIKDRLKVYLPCVKQANIGKQGSPILDLGCGRGEWLKILKEEGYVAKGIEINRVMLDVCREKNLDVAEAGAIEYLRSLKPNSLGAITGFHLVEHLSLKDLISLFDESFRALKPKGMIIFETPNPENLIVGAYTFHFDPTHRSPLVPESLNFIAQQRGFVNTNILRLHKYSDFNPIDQAADEFKNRWFYSETDFALIGYKS